MGGGGGWVQESFFFNFVAASVQRCQEDRGFVGTAEHRAVNTA